MNNNKRVRKYHFTLKIFFLIIIVSIAIFRLDGAHAELMLMNETASMMVNDGVDSMNKSDLRDPTKPLHYVNKKTAITESLTLQAIFTRSNNRSAVINGQHVNVGDVVSNHKVVTIGTKTVRLEKESKKITLNLRSGMHDAKQ